MLSGLVMCAANCSCQSCGRNKDSGISSKLCCLSKRSLKEAFSRGALTDAVSQKGSKRGAVTCSSP
jgi:hypothetical protein